MPRGRGHKRSHANPFPCGACGKPVEEVDDDHICGGCQRTFCSMCLSQVCYLCEYACCDECEESCRYCEQYNQDDYYEPDDYDSDYFGVIHDADYYDRPNSVLHKQCLPLHNEDCDYVISRNARSPAELAFKAAQELREKKEEDLAEAREKLSRLKQRIERLMEDVRTAMHEESEAKSAVYAERKGQTKRSKLALETRADGYS